MHKFSYVMGCLLGASTFVISLPGYADIPPADYCSVEGASCNNATGVEKAGICTKAQCSRRLPDGSFMSYDCFHCVAATVGEGGASSGGESGAGGAGAAAPLTGGTASTTGGTANTTGGSTATTGGTITTTGGTITTTGGTTATTGGAAGAAGDPKKDDDGGSGCRFSPLGAERGLAGLMTALGLSALFFARRRR